MKTISKSKILIAGIAVFVGLAAGVKFFLDAKSAPKTIKFVAAHGPYEVIMKPMEEFKASVEKNTNGRIKVEIIIPEGTDTTNLQRAEEALAGVQSGEYQMSQLYVAYASRFAKDFMALEVPFLFKNHEHSFATVDGEIGRELLAKLEQNSELKGLGFTYCGGYRILNTKNKKIKTIADFKGLKISTGARVSTEIFKALGVETVQRLQKFEIREQLASGQLDGDVSVYPRYFYNNDYKVANIVNELFFNMQYTVLTMNKDFFYSLSSEDQKIIEVAAQEASLKERRVAIEIAETVHKNAAQYGIVIANMLPKEKKLLIEKLSRINWEEKLNLSSGLVERIKNVSNFKVAKLVKE